MHLMDTLVNKGKAMMEPVRALNTLTRDALAQLAEQQVAATKEYIEFGKHSVQALGAARDPRALVNQQVALTKELGNTIMNSAQAYVRLATDTQAKFADWVEHTSGTMFAKAKAVVKPAT
jgi:hypothetical protein